LTVGLSKKVIIFALSPLPHCVPVTVPGGGAFCPDAGDASSMWCNGQRCGSFYQCVCNSGYSGASCDFCVPRSRRSVGGIPGGWEGAMGPGVRTTRAGSTAPEPRNSSFPILPHRRVHKTLLKFYHYFPISCVYLIYSLIILIFLEFHFFLLFSWFDHCPSSWV